jgi:hypothetical protein
VWTATAESILAKVARGRIILEKVALLTHPWVFVLWFAAFCGVLLITAGLIGSSR